MKKLASAAAFAALCTVAWSSSAQEIKFGDKGTLAIHAATGSPMVESGSLLRGYGGLRLGATPTLGVQSSTWKEPEDCNPAGCQQDSYHWTSFYINPRIHYFIIDNLSIGGEILFATFSGERERRERDGRKVTEEIDAAPTGFGIMPMIGYNIRISDKFSIWPHGGIGFRRFAWEYPNNELSETWWFFNADVPFMLNIAPHFSIGAGPGATFTLSNTVEQKTLGRTLPDRDYGITMWRWFNAHIVGYF